MPMHVQLRTDQLHGVLQMVQESWDAWRDEWLKLVAMVRAENFPRQRRHISARM
jgi:hypothetical protein